MRLGNGQEAAAAAEHIGRGHSFTMTELSIQRGRTDTAGTSRTSGTSTTVTDGTSTSRNRSRTYGTGLFADLTEGRTTTNMRSVAVGESIQDGVNESIANSTTLGETVTRVYEFEVEPTQIQSLDARSFVAVDTVDGTRRVMAGTVDPITSLLPRVSPLPLADASAANEVADRS